MTPPEISPPYYTSSQLRRAGKHLRNKKGRRKEDRDVLRHYLAWHEYQVQDIGQQFKARCPKHWWVSWRVKQAETICDKLAHNHQASLHTMQDIAGIRIVVPNMEELRAQMQGYEAVALANRNDPNVSMRRLDYVTHSQPSGYRGEHVSMRCVDSSLDPRFVNAFYIELQWRTRLQHLWATMVEACGAFMGMNLKSGEGDPEWLEFFALVSSAFALEEGASPLEKHAHMSRQELCAAIRDKVRQLDVMDLLRRFQMPMFYTMGTRRGYYTLMVMDVLRNRSSVRYYESKDYRRAYDDYIQEEIRAMEDTEFPNYRPFMMLRHSGFDSEFERGAPSRAMHPSDSTFPNYTMSFAAFEMALLSMMEQAEAAEEEP